MKFEYDDIKYVMRGIGKRNDLRNKSAYEGKKIYLQNESGLVGLEKYNEN
ncbi:MAG: hypothetical protein QW469_00665 [Candidatus Aenigmatarchaeota archaeon]